MPGEWLPGWLVLACWLPGSFSGFRLLFPARQRIFNQWNNYVSFPKPNGVCKIFNQRMRPIGGGAKGANLLNQIDDNAISQRRRVKPLKCL